MAELLNTVLAMSLTGSYVIVFVVVLRWLLRRLPKSYTCALWAVVLFRLLSPVTVRTPASVLPQPALPRAMPLLGEMTPLLPNPALPLPQVLPAAAPPPDLMTVLAWVWLGGALLLLGYSAICYLRLHRRVAGAVWVEANVYESAAIGSPFVLGLIKPKIYLPPDISPIERSYILRHEQIHIRTFDYLIKPLAFGTLCLHWFNPLCWLAFVLFGRDMEMSCDERVIRELGDNIRPNYSSSLLAMSTKGGFIGGGPLAFGESGVGQRIKNVLNFRKPAFWLALLAVLVVALAVGGLATNPVEKGGADFADTQTEITPEQPVSMPEPSSIPPQPEDTQEQGVIQLTNNGLTEVENQELAEQEARYDAMTEQEQYIALEGGTVGCKRFIHMWWEESIDMNLIRYVGVDAFGRWVKQLTDYKCASIYDFVRQYGLDYETFAELVTKNGLEELYPLDRVKPRFVYFNLPMSREEAHLQTLGEKYIEPTAVLGIFAYTWDSPEQIKPEDLTQFFLLDYTLIKKKEMPQYTFGGTPEQALAKYSDNIFMAASEDFSVAGIYVSEQTMHEGVQKRFDVTPEQIKQAPEYNASLEAYIYENWGFGGGGSVWVTAAREEPNNVLAIDFEIYVGEIREVVWHATVRVDTKEFKYLSCQYFDGL